MRKVKICFLLFVVLVLLKMPAMAEEMCNYYNGNDFYANAEYEFYINSDDEDKLYKLNLYDRAEEKILDEHIISIVTANNKLYMLTYNNFKSSLIEFDLDDYSYSKIKEFDSLVTNIVARNNVLYYIENQDVMSYNLENGEISVFLDNNNTDLLVFTDNNTLYYYTKDEESAGYIANIYKFDNSRIDNSQDESSLMALSSYTPRLTAPSTNDPYYTTLNIFHTSGYGMVGNGGNCTCYAYGRSYENLRKEPNLSTGNAGGWYSYNISGKYYTYGRTPSLGAVAVWSKTGAAGHVAVVEVINGDEVTTSESGWQSFYFKTVTRSASDSNFSASSAYSFLGFIYVCGEDLVESIDVKLSSPEDGSWQDPRKDIVIKWNAMEGAAGYRVAVKCDSGVHEGEKPYDNVWTTDTSFTIPYGTLYHNERYKIWVGGYESKSAGEALTAGDSISINIMSGPQIEYPANGYEYAHPANTTVRWTAVESADSYLITLINTDTDEDVYRNKDVGNTLSYRFTNLEENTTYKVAIGTDDGWWSQGDFYFATSTFPVISYPVNNEVCESENVTVKWSSIPGAEDYRLILKDESGNIVSGYDEVSTGGKTSYTVTGLEKGETYKVNVYGVINKGDIIQEFWGKETVVFSVAEDTEGEDNNITLNWRDCEDGEVKEYTIDSSSARPARPYAFFFETSSSETPIINVSDGSVIKAMLGDGRVTVTGVGSGNATLTLTVGGKCISLNFVITDTATEAETVLAWRDYEDGYVYECEVDLKNATTAKPLILYYETNSSDSPEVTNSDNSVINAVLNGGCVNVSYVGAGSSTLTLTINDVSIKFTVIVTDINDENAELVDSGTDANGINWTLDINGVLKFSGTGKMQDYADRTESPFYNNSDIKIVIVEDGVTSMGDYVLYGCENITSVLLAETIESIGFGSLYNCSSVENIYLPENICEIGSNAFYGCSSLTEVVIPESVSVIPKRCFMKCESLSKVILHDNITEIGEDAFRECSSLNEVELPEGLKTMGKYCFRDCASLERIVVTENVVTMGKGCFRGCTTLEEVEFLNSMEEISDDMFYDCGLLDSVLLPVGIEVIGNTAFDGCEKLSDVYFNGNESEWLTVVVGDGNESLTNANVHYNDSDADKKPFTIEISEDNLEVCFLITVKEKCVIYTAEYEDEIMTGASTTPVKADETVLITAEKTGEERLMKIFIWSDTLEPLTEVVERTIK